MSLILTFNKEVTELFKVKDSTNFLCWQKLQNLKYVTVYILFPILQCWLQQRLVGTSAHGKIFSREIDSTVTNVCLFVRLSSFFIHPSSFFIHPFILTFKLFSLLEYNLNFNNRI